MEKIYKVNNCSVEGTMIPGLKSRITRLNSRLWTVIAPMLFVAFGLFGVNESAWAGKVKLQLYSSPAEGGYVYANTEDKNNIGTKTSDDATSGYKVGGSVTMYRYASAKTGYEFRGWADGDGGTPSSTESSISLGANVGTSTKTYTYWAIFSALPKYYFKATATTNSSTYGNAYVTFTSSAANSTTDTEVTTNCYGTHYNTASMTKTAYFRAVPKSGYVFKGWSTDNTEANIFKTDAAITYELTSSSTNSASPASIRYYAIFGEKFAPQINGTASVNKEVGDSYTADFSFTNTSSTTPSSSSTADFYYTITHELSTSVNNGTNVISYNPSTGAIQALNAGKATITFINNSTATHQYKEESFVINVAKKEPTFSCGTSMNVGQNLSCTYTNTSANTPTANSSDNFYYVFTNNTPSGITTGSDTPGAILTFSGNKVYGKNAGTGTITFYQKETYMYKQKNSGAINVTVTKNNNELSCSWGSWSKNVNFDSHTDVTFTPTNTEAGAPAVTISKVSGGAVADYNSSTKQFDANHREGTVIWEVEQVENYKYVRALEKCTVNVGTVSAPNCDVPLYSFESQKVATSIGSITVNGLGVSLNFEINYNGAGGIVTVRKHYKNGSSDDETISATPFIGFSKKNISLGADVESVEFVKFGSDDPYIRNLTITRTKYFDIENKAGSTITEMTMPLNIHGGVVKRDTFYVDYSTCEGTIKLENHHPRIKFAATNSNTYSFSTGTSHYGRPAIALTYTSPANDAENITDTIYIYTPSDHKKLIVHAQSKGKLTTTLHYIGNASYTTDATNIAATDLFEVRDENEDVVDGAVITLGTGTTSNVTLANDNKSIASLCGNSNSGTTGNVTAFYAGDGSTYEAATNNGLSQNFTINRLDDEVSIDTHGHSVLVVGDTLDLTGWGSALSNSAITFTSGNLSYFKIEEGKIIALAKGDANLIATSAGNCVYNSGSTNTSIKVRNTNDPCSTLSLNKTGKITIKDGKSTTYNDITEGVYDKLEFKVWKQNLAASSNKTWVTLIGEADAELYSYEISADSLDKSENNAKTVVVNLANYQTLKKVQFTGNGSWYSQYFKDVKITRQAYLRANAGSGTLAANANVSMPNVKACEESSKDITISYSDISRIQLSHTNPAFTYEVYKGGNLIEDFDNDCGGYGEFTLRCKCTPTAKDTYSDVVTLSASGKTQVINLSFISDKADRTIVWTGVDEMNVVSATQTKTMTVQANTACQENAGTVYLTAIPADAVTIDGHNVTFNKSGLASVKLVAHTNPSDDYNDADTVYTWWNVGKVGLRIKTIDEVLKFPTITKTITYGDGALTAGDWNNDYVVEDTLNYEVVGGDIDYISPTSFTAAGPAELKFHFRPTNYDVYSDFDFYVPVTVQRATTTASANAIVLTYGETPDSKTLTTASAALDGTWSWNDDRSDDMLDASADAYALNVTFTPDNTNYAPYETTVNVTVNKATPAATVENVSFEYGTKAEDVELVGTGVGEWSWADSRKGETLAVDTYEMDVHFAPTDDANYNAIDTKITLTVNKIETLNVPVALSFCKGESVSYRDTTYTKAGTDKIEAVGATRDTVYNVTITELQPTTGTDSKTITLGDEETWNGIDLSGYAVGEHSVEAVLTNAVGCDSTVTLTLTVNAPATYVFEGDGNWENDDANWNTGENPTEPVDVTVNGNVIISTNVVVSSLTITDGSTVTLTETGNLTLGSEDSAAPNDKYGDLYVQNGGQVNLGSGKLKVNNFTLDAKLGNGSTKAASGQVSGPEAMNINGKAYFDLAFDPSGAISYGWYDFTVPFKVNIAGGIERIKSIDDKVMVSGVDFMIMEADEQNRANGGKGWRNVNSGALQPGKLYTITFNYQAALPQNTFRFTWNGEGSIANDTIYAAKYATGGDGSLNGWNGLGNGMLRHGYLATGYKLQAYCHETNTYDLVEEAKTFAVGSAFFIQVAEAGDVKWKMANATEDRPLYAPKREIQETEEFRLSLFAEESEIVSDYLFCSASEDATEAYIIGHDLLKMGTPTDSKVARMWANKGGKKLCDIEAALVNDKANCALGLYAPKAGSYWLAIDKGPNDAALYLTYNDAVIWDLTTSPYFLDLDKGTTNGYGLRIDAKKAPAVTTGVEQSEFSGQSSARKVMIDNKIYIVTPEGKMYDIIGKGVKF